jgi:hypothetical protein
MQLNTDNSGINFIVISQVALVKSWISGTREPAALCVPVNGVLTPDILTRDYKLKNCGPGSL